jgi:carboxymethylenebutenolidase
MNAMSPPPVDRREFMITIAGVGIALAALPVAAQTMITTDATGLVAGDIKIPVADGLMAGYRAQPARGKHFPVVLVVSEIFGVHAWIADICRRLAKLGYLAIAPDLFARQGDPRTMQDIPQIVSDIIAKTPDSEVMSDLDAAVRWAEAEGADTARLGVTGFCWGGRITWLYAAHNPSVKAGVAWYGKVKAAVNATTPQHPIDIAARLTVPVLGLYAGLDQSITLDQVDAMQAALRAVHSASEIHVYPNAQHGFLADYRPSYDQASAEDGWQRLQDWFKKYGV